MSQYTIRGGVDSFLQYGEEAVAYGTKAASVNKVFGLVQSFSTTPKRSLIKQRGVVGVLPAANTTTTARDPQKIMRGKFDGNMSISFNAYDFRFLKYVFGTESGSGTGAAPYNYPQATASTDSDKKAYMKVPSISMAIANYYGGAGDYADRQLDFLGGKVNSFTMTATKDNLITCELDVPYAEMQINPTLVTPTALPTNELFHFTGIAIEVPTGTPVQNIVDGFTMTVTNGIEMLHGCGSDIAKAARELGRDITLKLTLTDEGIEFLKLFQGGTTTLGAPTVINSIKITLTAETNRVVTITLLRLKQDDRVINHQMAQIVQEPLNLVAEVAYVTEQQTA